MEMEAIMNYIKPELLVVAFALYILGNVLKDSKHVKDEAIPVILGITGIILSILYLFATVSISTYKSVLMIIFTGITEGVLVAGLAVYFKQLIIQNTKKNLNSTEDDK